MIYQELIDRIESDIEDFDLPLHKDVVEILRNHKQLIEGNASLHREKIMLQNAMEQIAKSDTGASGNIARKIMASYGFEPNEN